MNNFKVKTLCAAIAGIGSLGAMSAAEAVYLNSDGLGQVLIYPYYTVNAKAGGAAPFQSLLSVVNSTASAKAVKVRFIEGRNSAEVLDFNLFLSAFDVWVAGIVPAPTISGAVGGAGVFTPDTSCTSPVVSNSAAAPTPFVNFQYAGANDDGAGEGLDRTREGYIEIIEMGNLTGTTAATVTHAAGGGKPECKNLADNAVNNAKIAADLRAPAAVCSAASRSSTTWPARTSPPTPWRSTSSARRVSTTLRAQSSRTSRTCRPRRRSSSTARTSSSRTRSGYPSTRSARS